MAEFDNSIANSLETEDGMDLIDAVLIADGKEFPVHTQILSIRSKFFKAFFNNSSEAATAGELSIKAIPHIYQSNAPKVFELDQEPKVLEKIIEHIYGNEKQKEFESYELAKATLFAASEYLLPEYEKICGSFLSSQINDKSFSELYNLGVLLKNNEILTKMRDITCTQIRPF